MVLINRLRIFFLLSFLLPALCWSQKKEVSIRIGQDETLLLDQYENEIVLKRKGFKIQVLLENVAGVYVFAAFTDSICCRLTEADSISGFMDLPDRTMREPEFNKDKELLVNDDNSCAYWYYDKETSWRGFNRKVVLLDDGRVVAVKTVKQLYYVPEQRAIKVKDIDIDKPLYLLFVAVSEFDGGGKPLKELMRRKVKISWVYDD
ncbi:MAG TPA: hypothetical protein VGO58_06690 [Chitinophagaceae bacterium]|jgi:hypothetical protein|nr:hypothetical protein [Chitinophagaceae bacterium]